MRIHYFIGLFCAITFQAAAQTAQYPVIDAHCHIKISPGDPYISMDGYFDANKSFDVKYLFGLTVANRGQLEKTRADNDSLLSMAHRNPRFIPVCSVHPDDGNAAIEELDRVAGLGAKIIKLHPLSQNFRILTENVINLTRIAGEKNLIVLIDGYGFLVNDYLDNLLQLSLINRHTKFIIAHMGGSDFFKLGSLKLVQRMNPGIFENVWYDISATVCIYADSPYQDQLEWVMRSVGTDRILFGTDNPVATLTEALEAFYKLDLNEEERERILCKNAMSLVGLE